MKKKPMVRPAYWKASFYAGDVESPVFRYRNRYSPLQSIALGRLRWFPRLKPAPHNRRRNPINGSKDHD